MFGRTPTCSGPGALRSLQMTVTEILRLIKMIDEKAADKPTL